MLYQCDYTIHLAHNNYIWKIIALPNGRFASCSDDGTIKIWNSNHPYELLRTLTGHSSGVTSILKLKKKDVLISSSYYDYILRFWNATTYQIITILEGVKCYKSNSLIEIDNNRIAVGGGD